MSINSYIYAASSFIPGEIVKSEDLMDELKSETHLGVSREIIGKKMGIYERRFATEEENGLSKLATNAAEKLIIENNIDSNDIDCVIYCGIERDYMEPSTAHIIQSNLGINSYCFDISNACHGFADGIFIANSFIKTGYDNVLLVTAEMPSYVTKLAIDSINKDSSRFKNLFGMLTVGDAAAAMLVSSDPGQLKLKITQIEAKCISYDYNLCYYHFPNNQFKGEMVMDKICAKTLLAQRNMLKEAKKKPDWTAPEYIIPHQVGKRPHLEVAKMFDLPVSRLSKTYEKLGNITSATIPVNIYNSLQRCDTPEYKNYLIFTTGSGIALSQISLRRH